MVSIFDIFFSDLYHGLLVDDLYGGITQRSYNQTASVEQRGRSGLGSTPKVSRCLSAGFSGWFFSSVVTTTNRPACHVKINWPSSGGPPFYPSTCGVIRLPVGPYLTVSPNVFGFVFESSSADNNGKGLVVENPSPKWLRTTTKMWRRRTRDRVPKQQETSVFLGARSRDAGGWAYLSSWREFFMIGTPGCRWR